MAKKNVRLPSVGDLRQPSRVRSSREGPQTDLGEGHREASKQTASRAIDFASGTTAKAEAQRNMDYATALAIQAAKEGDDSLLLPYSPSPSINPGRPRTWRAGYDPKTQTLRIRFRGGAGYEYYNVPPRVWRNFTRVKSPGRAINRTLNNYPYARADW